MIESLGVDSVYTGGDLQPGTPAFKFLLDWMGTFGVSLIPLGAVLLVAARDPLPNRLLVHLVIWHEVIAGVLDDAWFISRDYINGGFYVGFIVVHAIVIATAIHVLRRAPKLTANGPTRRERTSGAREDAT